jgi:hypothetical protein
VENKYDDVEALILAIEKARLLLNDSSKTQDDKDNIAVGFITENADALLSCLDELKNLREKSDSNLPLGGGFQSTHRVIVEGFSDSSAEQALSSALDKAAHYFAEDKDVSITIQQLKELQNGGHHVILEVHVTPLNLRLKPHVKGRDIELKRDHAKAYTEQRQKEHEALEHLVFDHFSALTKPKTMGHIPASYLINVNDAKLMHYMLEKQFLKAEMNLKFREAKKEIDLPEPSPDQPHKILVRVKH